MTRRQRVLIVDDDLTIRRWICAVLKPLDIDTITAASGEEALAAVVDAGETGFDLALLDVFMPGMSGYDLAQAFRKNADAPIASTPLIFLTAADDTHAKLTAFSHGAIDYIIKPFEPQELTARVKSALRTQALVEQLEIQANTDRLTGLLNRHALTTILQKRLDRLKSEPPNEIERRAGFCIFFIDLDRFKVINDSLGHEVGDHLLIAVADRMSRFNPVEGAAPNTPRPEVLVTRLGGDEFVLFIDRLVDPQQALAAASRLANTLDQPVQIQNQTLGAAASIGVRIADSAHHSVAELLRDADTAMYEAKAAGKGRAVLFDHSMHKRAVTRLTLEQDLTHAIANGNLLLHYQPIVSLRTNKIIRFEALVRWQDPKRGLVAPDSFIPLAEDTGLIRPLSNEVLRLACDQLKHWYSTFGSDHTPPVNINISPRQLFGPEMVEKIQRQLTDTQVQPQHLGIELTESSVTHDFDAASKTLGQLHDLGIHLSLDDFGTGYSSMTTLRNFPFNTIKIDRSFVSAMIDDRACAAIIAATTTLAFNLGMNVVAEGLESIDELQQLQALDCDAAQGYLISPPLDAVAATRLYQERGDQFFPPHLNTDTTSDAWIRDAG